MKQYIAYIFLFLEKTFWVFKTYIKKYIIFEFKRVSKDMQNEHEKRNIINKKNIWKRTYS